MGSFIEGMRMGQSAYQMAQDSARQAERDARWKTENEQKDADRERQLGLQAAEDEARTGLFAAQRGYVDGSKLPQGYWNGSGGPDTGPAQATGLVVPAAARLPANPLDINRASQKYAIAKGDMTAFSTLQQQGMELRGQDDDRNFIASTLELHKNKDTSPEASSKWTQALKPYTEMMSQFKGFAGDVRVNPKTNQIEVIPYEGGAVQPVDVNTAMPYLVVANKLLSKYGDPAKAVDAMHKMSTDELNRLVGIQDKKVSLAKDNADISLKRDTLAETKDYHARYVNALRDRSGTATRSASPATVKAINELTAKYQNTDDPAERRKLAKELNVLQAQASTEIGKPMQFKEPSREFTPQDVTALTEAYTGQPDPNDPKRPMTAMRARQVALSELQGSPTQSMSDILLANLPVEDPRKPAAAVSTPPARGLFTGKHGETQLLQPLFDTSGYVGGLRRRLQEQSADQ